MNETKHDLIIAGFDPYRETSGFYVDESNPLEPIPEEYYFDPEPGLAVCKFAEDYLVHAKGRWSNTPFVLTEWERKLILNLFGWKSTVTNLRRFRELFLTCSRKAGKTTLTTVLLWWFLCCEGEPGAEIYIAANSVEQAGKLWEVLTHQYNSSPALQKRVGYLKGKKRLLYPKKNPHSYIQLVSSDGKTSHGGSVQLVIFDELSWSKKNDLHTALTTGSGARTQPLFVTISTVSHLTDNVFANTLEHAHKVKRGIESDPRFLPAVFQIPPTQIIDGKEVETDWHDKSLWHLSNPNLHIGLPLDLNEQYQKALAIPSFVNEFKMTRLNMQCSSETQWLSLEQWDKQPEAMPDLTGVPCALGVDLSTSQDVTAFVATWFVDGVLYIDPYFFIPANNISERDRVHKTKYLTWHGGSDDNPNHLILTEGNSIDYPFVVSKILEFCESHTVETIYYDRYKWSSVISELLKQGLDCVAHSQGAAAMNSPIGEFERLVEAGKVYCKNPIFRWMISNARLSFDKGGCKTILKPTHTSPKKIDAVVAALMTLTHHTAVKEKVFDFKL